MASSCSPTPYTTPVIDLPAPPAPTVFTSRIPGWQDTALTSICLTVDVAGDLRPGSIGSPAQYVEEVIRAFGMNVVDHGCDARLDIRINAAMIPATYAGAGTCYSGFDVTTTANLSKVGLPEAAGSYRHHRDPPGYIPDTACVRDEQVGADRWEDALTGVGGLDGAITELVGDSWLIAMQVTDAGPGGAFHLYQSNFGENPVGDEVISLIIHRLHGEDPAGRKKAAQFTRDLAAATSPTQRKALEAVVPYLIRALALEDSRELETSGTLHDGQDWFSMSWNRKMPGQALRAITGETFDFRADRWWQWWQDQHG